MSSPIVAIASGGIGAAVGSVAVALIQVVGRKGESRATAADLVTNAAVGFIDRLKADNERLDRDNKKLRAALIQVTDVVDEAIAALDIGAADKERLHAVCNEAKKAM